MSSAFGFAQTFLLLMALKFNDRSHIRPLDMRLKILDAASGFTFSLAAFILAPDVCFFILMDHTLSYLPFQTGKYRFTPLFRTINTSPSLWISTLPGSRNHLNKKTTEVSFQIKKFIAKRYNLSVFLTVAAGQDDHILVTR